MVCVCVCVCVCSDTPTSTRPRKRPRRVSEWTRYKRKKLRNSGQAYKTKSNKQVS